VAVADDCSYVVAWHSSLGGPNNWDVYAQRFAADGSPAGGEFVVNSHTSFSQHTPAVAMAPNGDFVIVWDSEDSSNNNYGVHGQRFAADGAPIGTEIQVQINTFYLTLEPSVAMAHDGRFVAVWSTLGPGGSGYDIFGQRFASDGSPSGTELQVNTYTQLDQREPSVAMTGDGSFVVVWQSDGQDGDGLGVFGQRFAADGSALGSEFQVNTYTSHDQHSPAVTSAADGRFVVVWGSYHVSGGASDIFARRYAADGSPLGSELQVNVYSSSQLSPVAAMAPDGQFVVAWESDGQDGSLYGVFAQRYDPQGQPLGAGP